MTLRNMEEQRAGNSPSLSDRPTLFIFEFLCGGGCRDAPLPPELAEQGLAMLLAALEWVEVAAKPLRELEDIVLQANPLLITVKKIGDNYKKHFERPPRVSRPHGGGEPSGPFIRFAVAVTGELEISIAKETIASYVTSARKHWVGDW